MISALKEIKCNPGMCMICSEALATHLGARITKHLFQEQLGYVPHIIMQVKQMSLFLLIVHVLFGICQPQEGRKSDGGHECCSLGTLEVPS